MITEVRTIDPGTRRDAVEKIPRKILVADDDETVQMLLKRALESASDQLLSADNGIDTLRLALEESPDLIILDIFMPSMDGKDVLKALRRNRHTQLIPVIMLTGSGILADKLVGFELGADDYVTKPFEMDELRARVNSMLRRSNRDISANPLTRLPGSPAVQGFVSGKIRRRESFAFFYIDIDHFKVFNDVYGYAEGDRVIQDTASILLDMLKSVGRPNDFLGHIGGDDFVIVTDPACAESLAMAIAREFDRQVSSYYAAEDLVRGPVISKDRQGVERLVPLMTLSIAAATTETRNFSHYGKVVDIASEIKRYLKNLPASMRSLYLIDRRSDPTITPETQQAYTEALERQWKET